MPVFAAKNGEDNGDNGNDIPDINDEFVITDENGNKLHFTTMQMNTEDQKPQP
ncbi:MAG: hypothetical protein ACK5JF_00685 [Oscillospiraceae bacterium]